MPGRHVPMLFALAISLVPCSAMADATDPAAADALFQAGRAAMKSGDYDLARAKFAESQRLDPAPGTLLNLAQCEERLGKIATAVKNYKLAADSFAASDPRVAFARTRIAALSFRVPKLTIKLKPGAPDGTQVVLGREERRAANLGTAQPVDPGEYVIVVSAPGRGETETTVVIKAGESRTVTVAAGEAAEETDEPSEKDESSLSSDERKSRLRTIGYVAGGVGVVGLLAGTYYGLRSKSQDEKALETFNWATDTCKDQACVDWTDKSRTSAKISTVGFIGGGLLLATGIVLVIAAPSLAAPKAPKKVAVSVGGPGTWLGANVVGTW